MKGLKNSFLLKWANSASFQLWLQRHSSEIASVSKFCGNFYSGRADHSEIVYENGTIYKGNLYSGQKHGMGMFLTSNYKYEGEWQQDQVKAKQKAGKGTMMSLDYVYDGDWANDVQTGSGREIKGRNKYTGGFLNGKYHGAGILIDEAQNTYDGEWANGKKQGMGHWVSISGEQYCGEFYNDLFGGKGQLTFQNADIYVGGFVQGKMCGQGELLYLNGETYKGDFNENKPNGCGKLSKKNGIVVEGGFSDGVLNKTDCKVYYEDGRIYEGSVDEKFRPHGRGLLKHAAGTAEEGSWVHGIKDA
jgi:hypothetical protein